MNLVWFGPKIEVWLIKFGSLMRIAICMCTTNSILPYGGYSVIWLEAIKVGGGHGWYKQIEWLYKIKIVHQLFLHHLFIVGTALQVSLTKHKDLRQSTLHDTCRWVNFILGGGVWGATFVKCQRKSLEIPFFFLISLTCRIVGAPCVYSCAQRGKVTIKI